MQRLFLIALFMARNNTHQKSAACGTKSEGSVRLGSEKYAMRVHHVNMRVYNQSREMAYAPDPIATAVLADCKPNWIPVDLFFEMTDSLRGFTPEMALVIADDLVDCWSGYGLHLTGFSHIDSILGKIYARILMLAFKNNINLKY